MDRDASVALSRVASPAVGAGRTGSSVDIKKISNDAIIPTTCYSSDLDQIDSLAAPSRGLHVCPEPWRPGLRTAPVQLREGPTQVRQQINTPCACIAEIFM